MINHQSRREFVKQGGAVVAGSAFLHAAAQAQGGTGATGGQQSAGEIPRRAFGRTGVQVSAIGLGGYDLAKSRIEQESIRIVHEAIDAGITFMDNAWEYNEGLSEEWMGKALATGGRRQKVFLMTKVCTHGRDRQTAMKQLEESLRRLKTDHLDLWQVHEVIYDNDPERHFMKDGVIEALEQAKREGKVRFVGFTGHKDPAIHLEMLKRDFPFDACQLPLNAFDANFRSFEREVLPELNRRGIAAIGMKSLGGSGEPVKKGAISVPDALRYAMSLPVATTVSGIPSLGILYQNLAVARDFTPMNAQELAALRAKVAPMAADGRFELYKTSKKYDGATGREQHGFPTAEDLAI
ncbi:MAG: aldo/keto reductase [Pyrinomonadaceae bacterium]